MAWVFEGVVDLDGKNQMSFFVSLGAAEQLRGSTEHSADQL